MDYFIYTTQEAIENYIAANVVKLSSHEYELIVAVATCIFCKTQWGQSCQIGFPVVADQYRELDTTGEMDIKKVTELLRSGIQQNSPVDFSIRSTKDSSDGQKRKGMYVQTKRFGKGLTIKNSDVLIEYINDITYTSLPITLLVLLETGTELEMQRIQNSVNWKVFPFERMLTLSKQENKIVFCELFPGSGMEKYNLEQFFAI